MIDGIYNFWKPKGVTSHRFLGQIRHLVGKDIKVGHAGTLDPLAEGVLVVGIGKSTKKLDVEVAKEKEYVAEITFGMYSSTDDEEGEKQIVSSDISPTVEDIKKSFVNFLGEIEQVPPIYSAIKISGKKAYDLARKGKIVAMSPRKVLIKDIQIISFTYPKLVLKITTGKGVYIRSIARDLGSALKVGGYLSNLKRTRVGEYTEASSLSVDSFKEMLHLA